jgi:hypothetical protein
MACAIPSKREGVEGFIKASRQEHTFITTFALTK